MQRKKRCQHLVRGPEVWGKKRLLSQCLTCHADLAQCMHPGCHQWKVAKYITDHENITHKSETDTSSRRRARSGKGMVCTPIEGTKAHDAKQDSPSPPHAPNSTLSPPPRLSGTKRRRVDASVKNGNGRQTKVKVGCSLFP
mmetsp:Transcript_11892/g.21009  ORF Transcript_11892/g.21009 Transcript_11892/m.21009 type:complete len:141 (-) Transcript_11892:1276-1698(-)